ncbi:translation initiation factor IF-2-like [Choloepus didactylus]|uniref:translation initiation factor IF-2-like n=1 Tax=Choloepus didactylus TaxID=27675 RepID=UPI00189F7F3F|nr:translation initiation factor IF-2-like [Choloepus didactylus]
MRLSPRPMKPMNRGTTHSHVCCRFHTMQSLQRNSRGGSAAPSPPPPPPSGPPPAGRRRCRCRPPRCPPRPRRRGCRSGTRWRGSGRPFITRSRFFTFAPRGPRKRHGGREREGSGRGITEEAADREKEEAEDGQHANRLLPPRPSPREAGGGGEGGEGGRGRGPGRGLRGARERDETGPPPAERPSARRSPAPTAAAAAATAAARRLRALQSRRHPRDASAGSLPGAPAPRRLQGPRRPAAKYPRPASRIPTQGADLAAAAARRGPRATFLGGCFFRPGDEVHLFFSRSAANPRPALSGGDQSERSAEGERPGSPRSRTRGSAPPPPPESQTPACRAAAASPGPGAHRTPAVGALRLAAEGPRPAAEVPKSRSVGAGRRAAASGFPDGPDPGPKAAPGGSSSRAGAGPCVEPPRTGWASGRVAPPTNT